MQAWLAEGKRMSPSVLMGSLDCFVWQTLASVLVPGALIHKVVDATKWSVSKAAPGKDRIFAGLISTKASALMRADVRLGMPHSLLSGIQGG